MLQDSFKNKDREFIHTHHEYRFQLLSRYLVGESENEFHRQIDYMHNIFSDKSGPSPLLSLLTSISSIDKGSYHDFDEKDKLKSVILKSSPDFLAAIVNVTDSLQMAYNPDKMKKMIYLYLFDDVDAFNISVAQLQSIPEKWSIMDISEPRKTIDTAYNIFLEKKRLRDEIVKSPTLSAMPMLSKI